MFQILPLLSICPVKFNFLTFICELFLLYFYNGSGSFEHDSGFQTAQPEVQTCVPFWHECDPEFQDARHSSRALGRFLSAADIRSQLHREPAGERATQVLQEERPLQVQTLQHCAQGVGRPTSRQVSLAHPSLHPLPSFRSSSVGLFSEHPQQTF